MRDTQHLSILAPRFRITWALGLALGAGCGGPPPEKKITNPDLSGKIPAIVDAVERRDRRAVAQLVKELEDDDPAVRFYAIEGLRRLTGETLGYRYVDGEDERDQAVKRWQQWLGGQPASH